MKKEWHPRDTLKHAIKTIRERIKRHQRRIKQLRQVWPVLMEMGIIKEYGNIGLYDGEIQIEHSQILELRRRLGTKKFKVGRKQAYSGKIHVPLIPDNFPDLEFTYSYVPKETDRCKIINDMYQYQKIVCSI